MNEQLRSEDMGENARPSRVDSSVQTVQPLSGRVAEAIKFIEKTYRQAKVAEAARDSLKRKV